MDLQLSGTVTAVTGAASGIGRATVELLLAEGGQVAMLDRDEEGLTRAAATLVTRTSAADLAALTCDIRDERSVRSAAASIDQTFGRLDHLISCAGMSTLFGRELTEVTTEEWDAMMSVNLRGQWLAVKHLLPLLEKSTQPSVTLVASDSAIVFVPGDLVYSTSKGAALTFTRALSVELRRHGIRANCVCPSIVDTPMSRAALHLGAAGFADADYPVHTPNDIARYLVLLASPLTKTINGHALVADFGYSAMSTFPA